MESDWLEDLREYSQFHCSCIASRRYVRVVVLVILRFRCGRLGYTYDCFNVQCKTLILWGKAIDMRVVCRLALLCWNVQLDSFLCMKFTTAVFNFVSLCVYQYFNVSSKRVVLRGVISSHTISLPPTNQSDLNTRLHSLFNHRRYSAWNHH